MSTPKRTWSEPKAEATTSKSFPSRIWVEPNLEKKELFDRPVHKVLKPTPKTSTSNRGSIAPTLSLRSSHLTPSSSTFPRFKTVRKTEPLKTSDHQESLKERNSLIWLEILSHLQNFSQLFINTASSKYQYDHVKMVIWRFNANAVLRHFQIWQPFCDWCQPFGIHPAAITTSFLLDFIYEATHNIRKHSYNMKSLLQSLKFIASQAEVHTLLEILSSPVIQGYTNSSKKPRNPREVYPLPFHIASQLENYVCDRRYHISNRYIVGCFLAMFWSGLRFQDLQRTAPKSFTISEGIIRCISELTKSGHPQPAAFLACGMNSSSYYTGWGYVWYDLLQQWITSLHGTAPNFELDFLFPEVQGEGSYTSAMIPRPMPYSKAALILRHLAKQNFMAPPYDVKELGTITVHSTKSTLISAGKQLDLPRHWLNEQGHHRGTRNQSDRYSRDDTMYQLFLQKYIVERIKKGWRAVTPQARGGQKPIPQRPFSVSEDTIKWPPFLTPSAAILDTGREPKSVQTSTEIHQPDDSSSDHDQNSDSSDISSESSSTEDVTVLQSSFILNPFTRIAHCVLQKAEKAIPACGTSLTLELDQYKIVDFLPSDYDICQHKGCCRHTK